MSAEITDTTAGVSAPRWAIFADEITSCARNDSVSLSTAMSVIGTSSGPCVSACALDTASHAIQPIRSRTIAAPRRDQTRAALLTLSQETKLEQIIDLPILSAVA